VSDNEEFWGALVGIDLNCLKCDSVTKHIEAENIQDWHTFRPYRCTVCKKGERLYPLDPENQKWWR
jgi:hypothetical protein